MNFCPSAVYIMVQFMFLENMVAQYLNVNCSFLSDGCKKHILTQKCGLPCITPGKCYICTFTLFHYIRTSQLVSTIVAKRLKENLNISTEDIENVEAFLFSGRNNSRIN